MASIPFAFSVHHFISSVGADAGFAAIIGLAILVFLYFAQARETATLREQAAEAAQHMQELEARVAQLSRTGASTGSITSPPAPAPAPPGMARPTTRAAPAPALAASRAGAAPVSARAAAASAGGPASAAAPVGAPSAPAGVGAPPLSSATRLIPGSERDELTTYSNGGAGGAAVFTSAGPPPATAAGGANGVGGSRAAGGGSATIPPPVGAPRSAARPAPARPAAPPRRPGGPGSPRGTGSGGGGSRISRAVIILGSLLGVVAVVVVLLVVTSGGGSSSSSSSTSARTTNASARRSHGKQTAALKPASVTVAVLNGTSTSNLAHNVAQQLGGAGYKEGTIATAADQTHTATLIGYMPGHRAAALLVAKSLKLGSASVQPVDQSSRTVACPASSTPCSAQVVVTVGSDLASTP